MITLIGLVIFSVLVLLLGFWEIRIPFIVKEGKKNDRQRSHLKQALHMNEKLVKDSIENTILHTKFLKKIIKEEVI